MVASLPRRRPSIARPGRAGAVASGHAVAVRPVPPGAGGTARRPAPVPHRSGLAGPLRPGRHAGRADRRAQGGADATGRGARRPPSTPLAESTSRDGDTVKWLWGLPDATGRGSDRAAAICRRAQRHEHRDRAHALRPIARTVCVSTQAGCAMGCGFCATGQAGFERHLTWARSSSRWSGPDSGRARTIRPGGCPTSCSWAWASRWPTTTAPGRRSSACTTTWGSRPATSPCRPSGIVPGIRRLADEELPVNLAVSLHAANDELRNQLVPINARYPLAALAEACHAYLEAKGRRLSFEWALIDGVNDRPVDARELAAFARPLRAHVNLIPLNPTPGLPDPGLAARAGSGRSATAWARSGSTPPSGQPGHRHRRRLRPAARHPRPGPRRADADTGRAQAGSPRSRLRPGRPHHPRQRLARGPPRRRPRSRSDRRARPPGAGADHRRHAPAGRCGRGSRRSSPAAGRPVAPPPPGWPPGSGRGAAVDEGSVRGPPPRVGPASAACARVVSYRPDGCGPEPGHLGPGQQGGHQARPDGPNRAGSPGWNRDQHANPLAVPAGHEGGQIGLAPGIGVVDQDRPPGDPGPQRAERARPCPGPRAPRSTGAPAAVRRGPVRCDQLIASVVDVHRHLLDRGPHPRQGQVDQGHPADRAQRLGRRSVSGRSRRPSPAASTTPTSRAAVARSAAFRSGRFPARLSAMETRRWTNPSQPQTLYMATFLLYIEAFFNVLDGLAQPAVPRGGRGPGGRRHGHRQREALGLLPGGGHLPPSPCYPLLSDRDQRPRRPVQPERHPRRSCSRWRCSPCWCTHEPPVPEDLVPLGLVPQAGNGA